MSSFAEVSPAVSAAMRSLRDEPQDLGELLRDVALATAGSEPLIVLLAAYVNAAMSAFANTCATIFHIQGTKHGPISREKNEQRAVWLLVDLLVECFNDANPLGQYFSERNDVTSPVGSHW